MTTQKLTKKVAPKGWREIEAGLESNTSAEQTAERAAQAVQRIPASSATLWGQRGDDVQTLHCNPPPTSCTHGAATTNMTRQQCVCNYCGKVFRDFTSLAQERNALIF